MLRRNLNCFLPGLSRTPPNRHSTVRTAHGEHRENTNLTGWRRTFNGETVRGRANFAKLYLSIYATAYVIYKIRKWKSKKAAADVPEDVKFNRTIMNKK